MMRGLLLILLLLFILSTAALGLPTAHGYLYNMNLSVYMVGGDWPNPSEPYPYPEWWTLMGPNSYLAERYIVTPQPGLTSRPNITCGSDGGGVWLHFDNPYDEGKVNAYGVVGGYEAAKVRVSFDYNIGALPSGYQLQVWVRTFPATIPVWYSTSQNQQGHFSLERDFSPSWYSGIDILLTKNLVPEPASLWAMLCGLVSLAAAALRRRT